VEAREMISTQAKLIDSVAACFFIARNQRTSKSLATHYISIKPIHLKWQFWSEIQ
jgi:hypothetical protein